MDRENPINSCPFDNEKNKPDIFFVKEDYGIVILKGLQRRRMRKRGKPRTAARGPHAAKETQSCGME
jgi:hypothetical protein